MEQIPLSVTRRESTGKGVARKLRSSGQVPAVIYGTGQKAENLTVALNDLEKVLRQVTGSTAFLSLEIEGETARTAVLQQLQTDHLGRRLLHVDFYEVRPDQDLTLDVPLSFQGEAEGAGQGGIVTFAAHSVEVKGKVADIPDTVVVDISGLNIGDSLYAQDLGLPERVELVSEDNFQVATCSEPALPEEEPVEEEELEGEEEAAEGAEESSESPSEPKE
ncbi:MAG: 50S ribosomal protein L25 [Desulfarculaceae bacterium]|jgi:large subunit ribosomal protein L25